jgi:competence protein ComEA
MIVCAALLFVPVVMKSRTSQVIPARAAFCALSSGSIIVKVSGDVLHQGIYTMPANSLALDVIKMAVPLRPFELHKIDFAATRPLTTGSVVTISALPNGAQTATLSQMSVPERIALRIPLDIGSMSEADFDRLPGIGPALAKRIVEYRQNNGGVFRVEDLLEVEGIGEKKYKKIRTFF